MLTDLPIPMQVLDFLLKTVSIIGDAFQKDKTNLNNGYPILDWQYIDPAATCTVKFNVNPKNSVLTWKGEKLAVREDGVYTFEGVGVGDHDYKVSN